jgi:hypothetical protein
MKKTTLRPCDCVSKSDALRLDEQGIGYNNQSLTVEPNLVTLTIDSATIRIPMGLFRKFAEWYLEPQEVEPYNVPDNDTDSQ